MLIERLDLRVRVQAVIAAVAVVAALVVIAPQQANAACTGSSSWSSWTSWGKEDSQWASTCDGLNDYYGRVLDILTDGHKVRIRALPNGNNFYSGLSAGSWVNYNYIDSNSWTQFRLERIRVSDSALTAYGVWGTNQGF